jgi:hypothetical protein
VAALASAFLAAICPNSGAAAAKRIKPLRLKSGMNDIQEPPCGGNAKRFLQGSMEPIIQCNRFRQLPLSFKLHLYGQGIGVFPGSRDDLQRAWEFSAHLAFLSQIS